MLDTVTTTDPSTSIRARSEAHSRTIYAELRGAIEEGGFPAGSRLPTERELAERFKAARNTVRKTLNQLASEGLIVRMVGRGTFVADELPATSDFSLAELLEARLLFEPSLPDLVVERATAADVARLAQRLEAMRCAESWSAFKEAKYALHLAIAEAAGNRFMVSVFEQIIAARRRAGWGRPGGHPLPVTAVREVAYRENAEIVEALRQRDAERARRAIRDYLLRTLSSASSS